MIGVNSLLLDSDPAGITLDRYVDHIVYMMELAGLDAVGIGFDFFEAIYRALPAVERADLDAAVGEIRFPAGLTHHGHTRALTSRLIKRGFSDDAIAALLYGNWMQVLQNALGA